MLKLKNSKTKSNVYILLFFLGIIVSGYMYYFASYVPMKEQKLNDVAISTIRNIREEIVAKEGHYQRLLQTSHDLDDILDEKSENLDKLLDFNNDIADLYTAKYNNDASVVLKIDFIKNVKSFQAQQVSQLKSQRGAKGSPEFDIVKNELDNVRNEIEKIYRKKKWSEGDFIIKLGQKKYKRDSLKYIDSDKFPEEYKEYLKLKTEVYRYDPKKWKETVEDSRLANDSNYLSTENSLKDTIIADNYRDKTLHIFNPTHAFVDSIDALKIPHLSDSKDDTQLFTMKEGLRREVIISKLNTHQDSTETADSAHHEETDPLGNDDHMHIYGMVSMDDFMKGVTQSKLFNCVFLFDETNIFYSDNARILSQQSADSLSHFVESRIGIDIRKVSLNGKHYMQFTAPIVIGNESFHVSGLIDFNDYRSYTKGVPFLMLIFMLLAALFLISIVPSVKIFVISQWERLKLLDVSYTGIGIVLGIFVFGMLLISTTLYVQIERDTEKKLSDWGTEINASFCEEIKTYIKVIDSPIFGPSTANGLFHEMLVLKRDGHVQEIHLPYDSETSAVNPAGDYFTKVGSKTNLSGRRYFSSYGNGTNYRINISETDSSVLTPFYVESVYSRKRGKKEGIVSILSGDSIEPEAYVSIMSTDFKSVMQRNAPIGYQYAIVERSGKILFSSDREKNGLRNIFKQSDNCGFIKQGMANDITVKGEFEYGKRNFIAAIHPITSILAEQGGLESDYPLFVLTYVDKSILTWKTSTSSFMVGGIGLMIIILFIMIRGILWLMRYRDNDGPLTPSNFNSWLNPKAWKRKQYLLFIIGCIPAIVVLLLTAIFSNIDGLLMAAIMNVFYISGLRYAVLGRPDPACNDLGGETKTYKRNVYIYWLVYTSFCFIVCLQYGFSNPYFISICTWYVLGIILLVIANKMAHRMVNTENTSEDFGLVKRTYKAQLASWIVTIIIVPMAVVAYKSEKLVTNTFAHYAHQELEGRTAQEVIQYNFDYRKYIFNKDSLISNKPFVDFSVVADVVKIDSAMVADVPNKNIEKLLGNSITKPFFDGISSLYEETGSSGSVEQQAAITHPIPVQQYYKLQPRDSQRILVLFIVAFLIILAFAITTHIYTERIFFTVKGILQKKLCRVFEKDPNHGEQNWANILSNTNSKRFLLIGAPTSNRKNIIHSMVKAMEKSSGKTVPPPFYLNLDQIGAIGKDEFDIDGTIAAHASDIDKSEVLVIANWHSFDNTGIELENKLNLLMHLLNAKDYGKKTFVMLGSATLHQLEIYIKGKSFDTNEPMDSRIYFTYFKSIFRGFHEFVVPIHAENFQLGYSEVFRSDSSKGFSRNEQLLIEAQQLAPAFSSLWNSFSREEKFVLYDLADDGLVNPKNWEILLLLKQKGIILYNEEIYAFECFNPSFSYFVRQSISQEEALEMESLAKKKGSWMPIKFTLIIIVIALFGLVYNFNPSVLQGFLGIIGAIATSIAAFGRITDGLKVPFIKGK